MKRFIWNSPRREIEVEIIGHFILPERQERLMFLQASRRQDFVRSFHTEKFLNLSVATRVTTSTDIFAIMKKFGASDECYVVSAQLSLDAKTLSLREALEECVGFSIETLLYSPGTGVGYYEGGGYSERYVLSAKV